MLFLINLNFLILGDIGGQMGLFIGASILTILELFDYIYEVSVWITITLNSIHAILFGGIRAHCLPFPSILNDARLAGCSAP